MIPPCPRCGKDDFKKTRDLSAHLKRKFKCKPSPAPVVHTKGKDRRREKPEPIPISIPQDKNQENDPEADLGPSTQAYTLASPAREGQVESSEVSSRGKYIDRHARKPREHQKTWDAR